MSSKALKERAVLATLGVVAVYLLTAGLWFALLSTTWKKAAKRYVAERDKYERECRLIDNRQQWVEAYEEERSAMPIVSAGQVTDTLWLRKLNDLAVSNHIVITSLQAGEEVAAGDVLERTIEVKSWEGALESLVKFLYEVENTSGGMFDVRSLTMKPSKGGYLKGSFTFTCAYMREE